MALEQEIAKLVGKLKFEADNRPLTAFLKKMDEAKRKMDAFAASANKKIMLKVGVNSTAFKGELKKLADQQVSLNNVIVSGAALQAIRTKLQSLSRMRVVVHADVSTKRMGGSLRGRLNDMLSRLGSINIPTPKITLKVDRQALRSEIQSVLQQISREAKIKIDLKADVRHTGAGRRAPMGSGPAIAGGAALGGTAQHWGRGFVPGLGGAFAISQMNQINQKVQAAQTALEATSSSPEAYKDNLGFLQGIAKEQGRNFRDLAPDFTSILASAKGAIGDKGTQNLFRGLTKYGTVMGLDGESMKGSMRAISQMFSKDKIQAEEAQGQLAERLPAAMQLLAQANKTDVPGLRAQMQAGKLDPKKVLPEMARIMEELADKNNAYQKSLLSVRVAQGRMNYEFERSVGIFGKAGFDSALGNFFNVVAKGIEKAEPLVKALGSAFEYLVAPVTAIADLIASFGQHFQEFSDWLGIGSDQLILIGAAFLMLSSPLGAIVVGFAALALALQDIKTYLEGGNSLFGMWLDQLKPESQEKVKTMGTALRELGESLKTLGTMVVIGWKEIFAFWDEGSTVDTIVGNITKVSNAITTLVNGLKVLQSGDFTMKGVGDAVVDGATNLAKETVPYKVATKGLNIWSGIGTSVSDAARQYTGEFIQRYKSPAELEADAAKAKADQAEAQKVPPMMMLPGSLPAGSNPNAWQGPQAPTATFTGEVNLHFPNAQGDPESIQKAVAEVIGKAAQSISSNQTEGEQ